jgi:hypothetical protein
MNEQSRSIRAILPVHWAKSGKQQTSTVSAITVDGCYLEGDPAKVSVGEFIHIHVVLPLSPIRVTLQGQVQYKTALGFGVGFEPMSEGTKLLLERIVDLYMEKS